MLTPAENMLLERPEVRLQLAESARRDVVHPQSQLRAMVDWYRWHCEACRHPVDTWAVDACPHCGNDLSPPF